MSAIPATTAIPFVSFVVKGFSFSDPGDFGDDGDPGDRRYARQPSACVPQLMTPPPHSALLKTKTEVQFDRTVTDRSKSFFAFFGGRIRPNFSLIFPFLLFGRQRVAKWKGLGFLANCQLLIASCFVFKDHHRIAAPHWEGNGLFYHLFAFTSSKNQRETVLGFQSKPASIQAINSTFVIPTKFEHQIKTL